MLGLFFYLKAILFASCLSAHLQLGHNKKEDIAKRHKDWVINLLRPLGSTSESGRACAVGEEEEDVIQLIEDRQKDFAKRFSILEPFYNSRYGGCCVTHLSKLTDFEEDMRESFLELLKTIVVVNGHRFIGAMESLLTYMRDKESLQQADVSRVFLRIEEIALQAQAHCKQGAMFSESMNKALQDITEYSAKLMRTAAMKGHKFCGNFHAGSKNLYNSLLTGRQYEFDIMKAVDKVSNKDARLFLAYMEYTFKEPLKKLDIKARLIQLCPKIDASAAAELYLKAIRILAETTTEDEARKKINEAFEIAQQKPLETVDALAQSIEGKDKPKTSNNRIKKAKQKNRQTASVKDKSKLQDYGKQLSSSTLDQNKEAKQEAHTDLYKDDTDLPEDTEYAFVSVMDLQQRLNKSGFRFHPRVSRWDRATSAEIKNFDRNRERNYADRSEKEILLQKAFHDLQPVALLLCADEHKDYFFKTHKGKSAFATLEIDGSIYEGMIEIGILPEKVIYHLMFNDAVKHKPEQLFQIMEPKFEDAFEDSAEADKNFGQWCNKDGFTIEKQGDKYVITLDIPTSTATCAMHAPRRKLYIYPNKFLYKTY